MHNIFQTIGRLGVIPVVTLDDASQAMPVCQALLAGGLSVVEITFRTSAAAEAIAIVSREIPEMLVGAGTILTTDQAKQAFDSGATFMVSPGFNPRVVQFCIENKTPVTPGCSNPTDLTMAVEYGLDVVKFFPAESLGGLKMLKALAAPFRMLQFIPTGGIDPVNLREYLGFDRVLACGGTWIAKPDMVRSNDYGLITSVSRTSVEVVREFRELQKTVKG
ncbi:MAG: bifunctional 4-hydroxy-2-oxoglutarate aldolase/2-dehydro-3-deoxy-phosphogluconate aldolase [Armatimonadota bacterium]